MPQVQVTQDPVVVVLIVGLICLAVIVALLLAGPWTARMPRMPRTPASNDLEPPAPGDTPPSDPTDGSPEPAWASTRQTPPRYD